ncbi:1,3-beta-glucanosyltransferase, partial [Irineochytrium annulatum]
MTPPPASGMAFVDPAQGLVGGFGRSLSFLALAAFLPSAAAIDPNTNILTLNLTPSARNPHSAAASLATEPATESLTVWSRSYTEFAAHVTVGTPPQTLSLLLDTASAHMWTRTSMCTSPACVGGVSAFQPSNSSTFQTQHQPATTIAYLDGTTINGIVATDGVSIGPFTANAFAFMAATDIASPNPENIQSNDGTLGMSLPCSVASLGTGPTFMDTLAKQHTLPHNMASFYIDTTDKGGAVTLGGYSTQYFDNASDPIQWVPVVNSNLAPPTSPSTPYASLGFFALPILSVSLTDPITSTPLHNSTHTYPPTTSAAVIDTGTSDAVLPQPILTSLSAALHANPDPRSGALYVDCATILASSTTSPIISISLGSGVTLTLTAREYVITDLLGGCFINLAGHPAGEGMTLLGNT